MSVPIPHPWGNSNTWLVPFFWHVPSPLPLQTHYTLTSYNFLQQIWVSSSSLQPGSTLSMTGLSRSAVEATALKEAPHAWIRQFRKIKGPEISYNAPHLHHTDTLSDWEPSRFFQKLKKNASPWLLLSLLFCSIFSSSCGEKVTFLTRRIPLTLFLYKTQGRE